MSKKFNYIDLIIVNFIHFKTLQKTKNLKKIIENIDIGGPTLQSCCKNFYDVSVITDQKDYIT